MNEEILREERDHYIDLFHRVFDLLSAEDKKKFIDQLKKE